LKCFWNCKLDPKLTFFFTEEANAGLKVREEQTDIFGTMKDSAQEYTKTAEEIISLNRSERNSQYENKDEMFEFDETDPFHNN